MLRSVTDARDVGKFIYLLYASDRFTQPALFMLNSTGNSQAAAFLMWLIQGPSQHLPYTVTLCTRNRNYYTIEPFGLVLGPVPLP